MLSRKPAAKKAEAAEDKPAAATPEAKSGEQASGPKGLPDDLGKPATEALEGAGLTDLEQVAGKTEAELLDLKGVGPKAVETLEKALAEAGLSLKQTDKSEETD
jgi:DNA-directed RNA polymerase alpha subunit